VVGPNNRLFALESYGGNRIFDSLSGQSLGTFPGTLPPAVGSTNLYTLVGATLQSMTIASQQINWSFAGDGTLGTPPIVVNDTVFIGARSGNVYAVNASTGAQVWSAAAGSEIAAGGGYASYPALAAANGYLIVPAGTGLTAWKIVP
jgi:outer membrane protein assembly factor BamB